MKTIKEKLCKVSKLPLDENKFDHFKRREDKKQEKEFNEYLLPDGNQIYISQALQEEVGELLF